jgi:crotonobetainyl-CoA:carnitine CoA-transferase CaiB-like acyl-CoA transferase
MEDMMINGETPIELLRFGPPPFRRPTIQELENAMVEVINRMTDEEIAAELQAAGINMAPALAKLHAMIEQNQAQNNGGEDAR